MARSRFSRLLARLRGGAAGADGDEGDTTTRNKQRDYPGSIEEARERGIPIYVPFDTPSVASGPIRYEDDDPDKPDPYAALSDDVNTKAGESLEAATHHGESPGAPSRGQLRPLDDLRARLDLPDDLELLAHRVVLDRHEGHKVLDTACVQ